jgi:hypothetical protein
MNDIWEDVWSDLGGTFERIAISLRASFPKMFWSSGHNDNEAFPFWAYAAFNQERRVSEDVVATVDFHRSEDELRYSADIIFDDGPVLADGPTGIIDVSGGVTSARAEIEAAVRDIVRFLEASEQVLRDAISQQQ